MTEEVRSGARPVLPPAEIAAGLAVFAAIVIPMLAIKVASHDYPVDLAVYREAGRVVLHGVNPYNPGFGRDLRVPLPFTYPPFAALLAVVLAPEPSVAVAVLWTAVSLGLIVALVWRVLRPALLGAGREAGGPLAAVASWAPWQQGVLLGAVAGALTWTVPVYETIIFGQVNLILVAMCLADCIRTGPRRGVLVGVAAALKLTPGIFVAYFVATRQWAAAVRGAVTFAACEALAWVVLPGPSHLYWLHLAFSPGRTGNPHYYTNQSIYGLLFRLQLPHLLWWPLALAAGCVGLWRAAGAHRAGDELAAVALVGLTDLLVSPISWQHHAVWLILVFGVLAAWAGTGRRVALAVGMLAFFIVPVPLIGASLVVHHHLRLAGEPLRNGFLIVYGALLAWLPVRRGSPVPLRGERPVQ